jgi:opine dehydrogenase
MSTPQLAVLGGGNGAHAMAADAALRGISVTMYEMPEYESNVEHVRESGVIEAGGVISGRAEIQQVTTDIDAALDGADVVAVVVPAFAHAEYADLLAGHLDDDQLLVLFPGTFGSLEVRRIFDERGIHEDLLLAETDTLPYDTRLADDGTVQFYDENPVNLGVLPANRTDEALDRLDPYFEFGRVYDDVLEAGLSSVNPALHSGACVINVGPIEYWADGDFYLYEQGFVPSAAKLDVRLDEERKAVGDALGLSISSFEDFADLDDDWGWRDLYREIHGHIGLTPIEGPNDVESRYLTEDAPYGLVTWRSIAAELGVETPLIDAVVEIYATVHDRDWFSEGRTVADLGLDGLSADEMRTVAAHGQVAAPAGGDD